MILRLLVAHIAYHRNEMKQKRKLIKMDFFISHKNYVSGEWQKNYNPERFIFFALYIIQSQLKIEFNNDRKPCEFSGSNSYPYNFNKLLDIF